jgi:exodeoxyribonuclease VIII
MTENEYNAAEGIRRSDLWKMEDSPEKFLYFLEHPMEQTPAMAFGSACHKMILEPADFGNEYAIAPSIDRRTKTGKEEWEAFCNDNEGKTIISQDDAETMRGMEEALERCPLANKLIRGKGESEVAFFWTDPVTGEKCKIKTDRVVTYNRKKYIVDYKTTQCAETFRFNSEIWRLGYFMQAGMYAEGYKIANKKRKLPGFLFVVQEKKPPYAVNVIEASEEVMKAGVAKFHELLDRYHSCKTLDMFPGYVQDIPNDAFVPGWMEREMEDFE